MTDLSRSNKAAIWLRLSQRLSAADRDIQFDYAILPLIQDHLATVVCSFCSVMPLPPARMFHSQFIAAVVMSRENP